MSKNAENLPGYVGTQQNLRIERQLRASESQFSLRNFTKEKQANNLEKKMVEIKSLKTSSFASWNALLCSIKIVLAISSTIVFTYACAIQNIDEEFFNGTDFCQSHLICQFETLIQVTKYVLYSYAILCGIMSVLWLIRNCLMKDK